jgi:hypothetical protein
MYSLQIITIGYYLAKYIENNQVLQQASFKIMKTNKTAGAS